MQNGESVPDQARPPIAVNSSGWQRTAIIVVAAVIIAAGGYLVGLRTTQTPSEGNQEIALLTSPSPTTTPLPVAPPLPTLFVSNTFYTVPTTNPVLTSNWKTYKSDEYSFTFSYPPDMYVNTVPCPKDYKCHREQMALQTQQVLPGSKSLYEFLTYEGTSYNYLQLYVTFDPLEPFYHTLPNPKYEKVVIGGKKVGIYTSDYAYQTGDTTYQRDITIPLKENNKKTLYIQIAYSDLGKNAITVDEFNQILSTFKFSDQH